MAQTRSKALADAVARKLLDEFSRTSLRAALRVLEDKHNAFRLHLYSVAVREMLTYTLHC